MLRIRCTDEDARRIKEYLSEDEKPVFDMRRAGKSRVEMAFKLHCSESTIRDRMAKIKQVIAHCPNIARTES